jgi:hypothetical protein
MCELIALERSNLKACELLDVVFSQLDAVAPSTMDKHDFWDWMSTSHNDLVNVC